MAAPANLTLFVEGEYDPAAAALLVKRLLGAMPTPPWDALVLDPKRPFTVGSLSQLVPCQKGKPPDWTGWVELLRSAARTRKPLGAVLLLLDGDMDRFDGQPFCPATVARRLAAEAAAEGAGSTFSVGVVFAMKEYEAWLIPGLNTFADRVTDLKLPPDIEARRDAKKVLKENLKGGYKPTRNQLPLTAALDLDAVRAANLRSFRRLQDALVELVAACRAGRHVVTPRLPPPPPLAP